MTRQQRITVLVADDIEDTCENIKKLLMFESDIEVVGACNDGQKAVEQCRQLTPDIVLMDVSMPGLDGITATEVIRAEWPATQVIIMSDHEEPDYMRRSMLAGAREFLVKPFTGDVLVTAIHRVFERADRTVAPTARPVETTHAEPTMGQIVTVFSPKGGVGRTTIACNLAVALRQTGSKSVALVDCNLSFGDIGVLMNLQPTKTIVDLLSHLAALDDDLLRELLVSHPSGVDVLLAPIRPEMAELVTSDALKRILTRLRETYEYVVVDTWPSFQEEMLAVLDLSDRILVPITLEMPAIKNAKLFLEVARVLGYPDDKTTLVVNRADLSAGISIRDVETNLGRAIPVRIATDVKLAANAINQGIPLITLKQKSQLARGILDLASVVSRPAASADSSSTDAKPRRGIPLLSRLFGDGRREPELASAGVAPAKR